MGAYVVPAGGFTIANYKKPEGILLGFEYEIDTRVEERALRNLIKEKLPSHYAFAYEPLDHSNNYGFEIKSSVAPLLRIKSEIHSIKDIINWPIYDPKHNVGGIHINVSKTPYTNSVYQKVFSFLHHQTNKEWLLLLSKRTESSFNLFSPCHTDWKKYYGIITTRKAFAYEFRMFKANPELLIPACEFIHAIFEFAGRTEDSITLDSLIGFIRKYKRYQSIFELMETTVKSPYSDVPQCDGAVMRGQ